MTNPIAMPGPGDEITWGPYTGHPGDPRAPDLTPYIEREAARIMAEATENAEAFEEFAGESDLCLDTEFWGAVAAVVREPTKETALALSSRVDEFMAEIAEKAMAKQ